MNIIAGAILNSYRRLKDKSVSINLILNEQTSEQLMLIDQLQDKFGYFMFKANQELTPHEIKDLDSLDTEMFDSPKTKSQRLRNVLYKTWEQNNEGYKEYKEYYSAKMEVIISH